MARKRKRTALVDGDIIAYIVTTQCEQPTRWNEDLWTLHSHLQENIDKFCDTITYYQEITLCSDVVITFTHPKNFRKKVLPTYKANRKDLRKPLCYGPLKEYVKENFKVYEKPWLEGDDVLGILHTSSVINGDKVTITKDKDLRTVPGMHYFFNDAGHYEEINNQQADYNHMIQTLTGDASDNYSGCPGVGVVGARKLLDEIKNDPIAMWYKVVERFNKAGLSEEQALIQAQVSRICRASDYNFETKSPILWRKPL